MTTATTLRRRMKHWQWRQPAPLPDNGTPLYERLPSESSKCYLYLTTYLNLGPLRTLRAVATQHGRTERLIQYIAKKYHWPTRARAWDDWIDRQTRGNAVQRHADLAARSLDLVEEALDALDPGALTTREVARLFEIAVKVGNLSRGLATERTATSHMGGIAVQHQISDEARERLARRLAEIADRDPQPTALDMQKPVWGGRSGY